MRFDYMPFIKNLLKDDTLIEKVNASIWKTGYWNQLDLGQDPEDVFGRMLSDGEEVQDEIRLTLEHVGDCISKTDYAIPWIRELKERGFQVLYLSNYSEYIMNAGPEALDFLPYMDGGVFSCHVGMIKPDPAIYRKICDTYDLNPEECVFIDDNEDNIDAARKFGLDAIHFENYEQAKEELEKKLNG